MNFDDKTMALAKFLDIDPELIDNRYSEYFTVNERTIKEGKTPEDFQKTVDDFKSLLSPTMRGLITKAIKGSAGIKAVYKTVEEYLEPLQERAKKRDEILTRNPYQIIRKETPEDVYLRLKRGNIFVENILFNLLHADKYGGDHNEQMRRAWRGKPLSDTRKDRTVNDGEYLVLTDGEADNWEEEYLDNLFDDMMGEIPDSMRRYVNSELFVEENSGNRGENISGYDGTENEVEYDGTTYYIYRHN